MFVVAVGWLKLFLYFSVGKGFARTEFGFRVCGPESSSGAPYKVTIRVPQLVATYAGWHWATPI